MISPTLYSTLLKLRHNSESRLIWCDGLCIDQSQELESLRERSQQVQMMFEIYSTAQRVAIDLGDDLGRSHHDFVQGLYQLAAISTKCYSSVAPYTYEYASHEENVENTESISMSEESSSEIKREEGTPQEDSHSVKSFMCILPASVRQKWLWQTFADLLSRPYFKRLWV